MSSYQVIARKYRPQRFSDVVGQEHVTQTLGHAIEAGRIAHAYLFCGPRGTGKTTVARIFAKCLRCQNGPTAEPCNECPECRAISEGNSMDMMEFDAASNTQVEKIRDIIIDHVKYAPSTGKYKLYLVDEVHMLSTSSFNALLKTLEEPPPHVKFLFATTDPEKLPATILSRCQRFDLRRIPIKLMVNHLRAIAEQEKVQIAEEALFAIARGADGGMRDAESALDQLISFCGNQIVEADVLSMFGLTSQGQLLSLSAALLNGDSEAALREFNDLTKHGKDLGKFVADLLLHLRNLLIYGISRGDSRLLEISEAEAAIMAEQSKLVSTDALTRMMEVLTAAEAGMRDAASRKIYIEVALMKAIDARNAVSIDTVLKRLNELRGEGGGSAAAPAPTAQPAQAVPRPAAFQPVRMSPSLPVPPSASPPTPAAPKAVPSPASVPQPPVAPSAAASAAVDTSNLDVDEVWAKVIQFLGANPAYKFPHTYYSPAHPVSLVKNVLTIGFDPSVAENMVFAETTKNQASVIAALASLGLPDLKLKLIKEPRPEGFVAPSAPDTPEPEPAANPSPAAPRPAASSASGASLPATAPAKAAAAPAKSAAPTAKPVQLDPGEFKDDPLIKKALEIFRGTIVEVRA